MGVLIDGVWTDSELPQETGEGGQFRRADSRFRGRITADGSSGFKAEPGRLMVKNIEVSGLQISDYRRRMPGQMAACFKEIFALYEAGKLKPAPTTVSPIEDAAKALAEIRDRKVRGRIVLSQGKD